MCKGGLELLVVCMACKMWGGGISTEQAMTSNFVTVDMWVSDQLFLKGSPHEGPTDQVPAFTYDVKFFDVRSYFWVCQPYYFTVCTKYIRIEFEAFFGGGI